MKNDETQTELKILKWKKTETTLLVTLVVLSLVSGATFPLGIPTSLFNILYKADSLMAVCFPAFLVWKYPKPDSVPKKIFLLLGLALKLFFIFLISFVFFMLLGELVGVLLCYVTGQGVRTN